MMLHSFGPWCALGRMRFGERSGRALYLVATLALTVLAWQVLSAFGARFDDTRVKPLGAVTVQSARTGEALPLRHAARIAQLEGVADVAYMTLLPLKCKPPVTVAALNAWGGLSVPWRAQFPEISAEALAAWQADPMAILVGAQLAERCDWRRGMTIQPPDFVTGRPTEVHVAGVFNASSGLGESIAIAHYDYINRLLPREEQDKARMLHVRGTDPGRLPELANRIEAAFAADIAPVQAHTSSETESALGRFGNVSALILLVMVAMLICALLVFISTLAHIAAGRRASMAMLQTLGFGRGSLFAGLVFEFAMILAAGTLLGLGAAQGVLHLLAPRVVHLVGYPTTPFEAYLWLGAGLLTLALLSLLIPGRVIARLRPIDHASV